jgi:hypothetical protein
MSEEAPKTIFLSDDIPRLLFFEGEIDFVEYIRKDEYDELQTKYDNLDVDCHRFHVANFDLQARIKKLEEALRFYTDADNFDNVQEDPTDEPLCLVEDIHGNLEDFGTTARNALAKENT